MKRVLKILAIYSIAILSYALLVTFLVIGGQLFLTLQSALITLFSILPVIIFAILVLVYLKKVK